MTKLTLCLVCFCSTLATAGENPWETQRTEPILIKTRARPGSDVKEIWAEGDLAATPQQIQITVIDVKRFTVFMPYMTESRLIGGVEPDGAQYTYARLDVPVLSPRDFIHKAYVLRDAARDPEGVFENYWFAAPTKLPEVPSVVRLKISEGSWKVTPSADGKSSHVVYRLCVDPGGAIPAFAANRANADGLTDTFKNIEREAQRRAAAKP
jgi:hypothetical protein